MSLERTRWALAVASLVAVGCAQRPPAVRVYDGVVSEVDSTAAIVVPADQPAALLQSVTATLDHMTRTEIPRQGVLSLRAECGPRVMRMRQRIVSVLIAARARGSLFSFSASAQQDTEAAVELTITDCTTGQELHRHVYRTRFENPAELVDHIAGWHVSVAGGYAMK